jgi:hypothetical protein
MAHTTSDARIAGLRAAMEPADPRQVPAMFSHNEALAAAWLEAYDSMSTSMMNQRYGVMEAPTAPERKPRVKTVKTAPSAPKITARPTMMAILDQQMADQL